MIALIDSGAYINCIQEGLIPTKYYEKTLEGVTIIEKGLMVEKLGKEICFEFVKPPRTRQLNLLEEALIKIDRKKNQINLLNKEIKFKRIEEQLKSIKIQETIKKYENKIIKEICFLA
ncbi:hypothetical protein CR513_53114, partial [Mucuna pruriens]